MTRANETLASFKGLESFRVWGSTVLLLQVVAVLTFASSDTVSLIQLSPIPPSDSFCLPARVKVCQVTPKPDTALRILVRISHNRRAEWRLRAADARAGARMLLVAAQRTDTIGPVALNSYRLTFKCDVLNCSASVTSPAVWLSNYAYLRPGPFPKSQMQPFADALWYVGTGTKPAGVTYPLTWESARE